MALRTFTVEYRVSGQLDGSTPSPPLSIARVQANGIYRFAVTNLGLVDPSYDGEVGSIGDRLMRDLVLAAPDAPVNGEVAIVSGGIVYDTILTPTTTLEQFVNCVPLPQGSMLRFDGYDASGDPTPIVLRMKFTASDSTESYPDLLQACCCCQSPPVIQSITWPGMPTCIPCTGTSGDRTVTMVVKNLSPDALLEVFAGGDGDCVTGAFGYSNIVFTPDSANTTTVTFLMTCGSEQDNCPYTVRITNSPGCFDEVVNAFCLDGPCADPPVITNVTWPSDPTCLNIDGLEAARTITVTGTSFAPGADVEVYPTGADPSCQAAVLTISNLLIISDTEIEFVVTNAGGSIAECDFGVRVINSPGCQDELDDAFCADSGA
jgi:hypothetical protein